MLKSVFIIFLLTAALSLTSCLNASEDDIPELLIPEGFQMRLNTAIVTRGTIASVERYPGMMRVDSEGLTLGALSGVFQRFYVQAGDHVVAGQPLASITSVSLTNRIENLEERITNMRFNNRIDNELTAIDIQIRERENAALFRSAAESFDASAMNRAQEREREIERAWYALEAAIERQAMQLRHEEEYLAALRRQYSEFTLRAPFDGVVTDVVYRTPDSWVGNFHRLVYVAPHDAQVYFQYIGPSTAAIVTRAVRIQVRISDESFYTTRRFLTQRESIRFTQAFTPIPLRFTLNTDNPPPAGSFGAMYVYRVYIEDALRIPHNSYFTDPIIGDYVHRVVNGELVLTTVRLGVRAGGFAEVIDGLSEGDVIHVGG